MIYILLNILIFIGLLYSLYYLASKHYSFSTRVFVALGLGIVFGVILYNVYPSEVILKTKEYFDVVGRGYVALLRMISIPLIMVSITSSIVNLNDTKDASKMGSLIIGILLATTAIASTITIPITLLFKLDSSSIVRGSAEIARGEKLLELSGQVNQTITDKIVSFIPSNPFLDMTGARATSTIAVVVFCVFVGISILGVKKKKPESAKVIIDLINAANDVVLRMVKLVLRLTPYGVFALITNVLATSNYSEIYSLIKFVGVSYMALFTMYIIHLIIVSLLGFSPIVYIKKTIPLLSFAFTSRTSAGAIPLNISTQESLGINEGIANMSATFGTSIGQNGCAGIYPTMLALMIAPTLGINVLDPVFLIRVVLVVTISSLGVAGVGGGATFAAIIVLTTLGLPVELAGLLISVEPLIDMGRTALNVNGSVVAGLSTSRILNLVNKDKYYN